MVNDFYTRMREIIRTSDVLFYRHDDDERSYRDLWESILRLNTVLCNHRNQRVAVYGDKGFPVYCCVFATLLSGNTWIPMDPATPDERNAAMVEQADPSVILTDRDLPEAMAASASGSGAEVVRIDALLSADEKTEIEPVDFDKDDLSMIYFTSGSTGVPKGVQITHENYVINVDNILRLIDFDPPEVFADYHDLGFVISVPILFPCVMTESAVSPAIQLVDQFMPANHMIRNKISVLITVPSTIARIRKLKRDDQSFDDLNVLISCGEPLHLDILEFSLTGMDANHVYNFYGSTEVAPWTFHHVCRASDLESYKSLGYTPIGNPIEGNKVRISKAGELQVSGAQVTPGYLGGVDDSHFRVEGDRRWYLTGDKVMVQDGVYICKGRLDSQVKLHGHRVELMDVESQLRRLDGIESAICYTDGEDAAKMIVAVMITAKSYNLSEVRAFLEDKLPGYMLPRQVFCTADAPLNKSGKIDRARLRELYGEK